MISTGAGLSRIAEAGTNARMLTHAHAPGHHPAAAVDDPRSFRGHRSGRHLRRYRPAMRHARARVDRGGYSRVNTCSLRTSVRLQTLRLSSQAHSTARSSVHRNSFDRLAPAQRPHSGFCRFTAADRPWELRVTIEFADEAGAVAFEEYLKTGSGRAFSKRHFR
jgi:putative endonuclease